MTSYLAKLWTWIFPPPEPPTTYQQQRLSGLCAKLADMGGGAYDHEWPPKEFADVASLATRLNLMSAGGGWSNTWGLTKAGWACAGREAPVARSLAPATLLAVPAE